MHILLYLLFGIVCVLCAALGIHVIMLKQELRSLYLQLKEIEDGSHMELATVHGQRQFAAVCGLLNEIFASRDADRIQYEKAERVLKQNITGLAHDIRTPLTGASGYVQLAKECTDPEKRERCLECAEWRLRDLEDMLEELFLYTKLTSEGFSLSQSCLQLLPILEECLFCMYGRFEQLGLSPEVKFESEGFRIYGDSEAVKRIFLNLIQNALIHGEGGICIRQENLSLIFENKITKDGQPDLSQMFDRFYKGSQARRKGSSGLGLFIVKELMEKMGGSAEARLEEDRLQIVLDFSGGASAPPSVQNETCLR